MKPVYFVEANVRMGALCYLPLSSGLLRANAETSEIVKGHYTFKPFIYAIDPLQTILDRFDEAPAVLALSLSMWNEQISLVVAESVKARWPDCLVVMGGPQVPHHPVEFMERYRFVDICVRGEGEEAFREILERFTESRTFDNIMGATWRAEDGEIIYLPGERPFERALDIYPSPYLEGLFDDLAVGDAPPFQAIIETNRGCPFMCTFCYWGKGGLSRKYRYHDLERVYSELEWCAAHGIRYVFNADSNFGMNKRDSEIADYLVALKQRTGFPDKFRTCFGKNTDDKIFEIGALFHKHNLEKGITLARQSNDLDVLVNIKRGNIKMETYRSLQARFNDQNIPIYSELILGLPGETVETWRKGIDELLSAGLRNQLFIYFCQVYPNTDLADPDYQAKFGIQTRLVELNEIHGSVRDAALVPEYEDIITATNAMPLADWRRMAILSWITMLMHSLKLGFYVMAWLFDRYGLRHVDFLDYLASGKFSGAAMIKAEIAAFEDKLDDILSGSGRGCIVDGCGITYWDVEEAAFIRCMEDAERFYGDMRGVVAEFLTQNGVKYDETELAEVVAYQQARIPTRFIGGSEDISFEHNWPDYFEARFTNSPVELLREPQGMTVHPIDYAGDIERFARESILWGRKSGTLLVEVEPHKAMQKARAG
jgi:radical SAM superfamily enzyme YgiQ (UPF0313 family)